MNTEPRLREIWTATWTRIGQPAPSGMLERLLARYGEPHRHFHTARHLLAVVAWLEDEAIDDALRLAAWFHDAIYAPGRSDNESRSAALARRELGATGASAAMIERVAAGVVATASHQSTDNSVHALLDADLAILGAPAPEYAAYVDAIAREYRAVPRFIYRRGRAAFLRGMLARTTLFHTARARAQREQPARHNLTEELRHLESAG